MTPERWRQAMDIFDAALLREQTERDAFINSLCAHDEWLGQAVHSLLAAHEDAAGFGSAPVMSMVAQVTSGSSFVRLSGAAVGPYTIGGLIGAGSMGQVYRARDGRLHRDVAIKVLPIEISNEESALRRVEREARALGALNHPNIAAIYDVIRDDGAAYLVLELVEGTDLATRLRDGAMPIDEALGVAAQIADALAAAHAAGIVHRDLKPANIKITPAGRVKVLDFGVSSTLDRTDEHDPGAPASTSDPRVTLLAGTPAYMSPEQARGQRVDGRADLWAFGCVVYELLTGHRAFPAPKPIPPSDSGVDSEPDWSLVPLDAPRSLTDVIRSCLTHDVEQRFRHATQVQRAIETLRSSPLVTLAHQPAKGHEPNLRAYEAFQRAGQNQQRLVRATWEEQGVNIEECLNEAIAADPQWAAPHSSLAQLYVAWAEFRSQQGQWLPRARAEAAKALELLPGEPVACAVLGTIAGVYEYDWGTAAEQFAVAATSEFVPPSVRQAYAGYYLAPLGRFTEALAQLEQAVTVDPLNMLCRGRYLQILLFAELYDRAIAEGKKQLEFDEKHIAAHSMIALAHFFQGTLTDARQWAEEAVRRTPLNTLAVGTLAGLLTRHGEKDRVQELDTSLRNMVPMGLGLGMVIKHLVTSEVDAALDWYEYAVEHRLSFPAEWAAAGCLRPLRSSPRWSKLARAMKLPQSDY